jgi:hypothetical protein
MNKSLNISQVVRKRIALVLLLNFILTTILFSFPNEECNAMCTVTNQSHSCSKRETKNCSCDMSNMKGNINLSHQNNKEFSKESCDYKFTLNDGYTFLVPKTEESKIVLTTISIIDISIVQDNQKNHNNITKNIVFDTGPPIYIIVSSYLI